MKNKRWLIFLDFLSLAAVFVTNYLAVNLPLNGLTTKQISDSFDIYFVPAGYVFLIWGVIYTQQLVYLIYRVLPGQRDNQELAAIDGWFVLINLLNILWLLSFHYRHFILALVFILLLLVVLIHVFLMLNIGRRRTRMPWRWFVEATFSVYTGWISVATIANVTQVLDYLHWDGFGIASEAWFIFTVVLIVGISTIASFTRRVFEFNLVLIWALVGIALKFPHVAPVNYSAWGGAIMIAFLGMVALAVPINMESRD
jgi:hypothetical protein